jgi:3-phytase
VRDVGAGQLKSPKGIAVLDDLAFVVERGNARVQVFRLPAFASLGTFGSGSLQSPSGITLEKKDAGYRVLVTDNFEINTKANRDSIWTRRIHQFDVQLQGNRVRGAAHAPVGDDRGAGRVRVGESIATDPELDRMLVAEQEEGASSIKVFARAGRFIGQITSSFFPNRAAGVALYACAGGDGYWVMNDQGKQVNIFHVFERRSLRHAGSFRLNGVSNTTGIAVTHRAFASYPAGAFYAINDAAGVAGVSWQTVAKALSLGGCAAAQGKG